MYAVSQILHLGIATAVTAAVATTPILANGLVAFGLGAAAPVVVKKVSSYTLALLPRQPDEPESIGGAGDDE